MGTHWGQPMLAPSALSCQPCPVSQAPPAQSCQPSPGSPVPAQARLVLVMLWGSGQPPAGSCCPGDTVVAQLVAPLQQSSCSCRNISGITGTTQVPSKINTLNCLRPTGAEPSQEERCQDRSPPWVALARPKTLLHTLSWDRPKLCRGAGGPLGRQTSTALA